MSQFKIPITITILFCFLLVPAFADRDVVFYDMTNSQLSVPKKIDNVVTIGAVPVLSSFVFALGKGDTVKNALPKMFTKAMVGRLYYSMAPNASKAALYTMNDAASSVNIESLLKDKPQLVLTMDAMTAKTLRDKGLNTACLLWRNEDDAKRLMLFLGDVFGVKDRAAIYNDYVDKKLAYVRTKIASVPNNEKQKVLYFDYKSMSNPHLIADWWIAKAGGISVTDSDRKTEKHAFSLEQILSWNPDVIVVANPNDIDEIYKNKALSTVSAVKNRHIVASPSGVHLWANRTAEQTLMILWAAKQFYPKYFSDLDIQKETMEFYSRFFNYKLNRRELKDILEPLPKGENK